jgi:DtxR family Mn-dependent transcriptional regulator
VGDGGCPFQLGGIPRLPTTGPCSSDRDVRPHGRWLLYPQTVSVADLSSSTQDYLKVIWGFQEWSDAPVTTSGIAERLRLKPSTVSDALRRLTEQGMVEHAPYGSVSLTPPGRTLALAMVRRHRLIETFLVQVLNYSWDEVHNEAERLEHAVSDLMIERIDALLGRPARDPHGDPIPSAEGVVNRPRAVPLLTLPPQTPVRVERISDSDPDRLRYFASRGITLDANLDIMEAGPYSDGVVIRVDGHPQTVHLGEASSGAIWVSTNAMRALSDS